MHGGIMPNTESCRKRLRQDVKRQAKNNFVKKTIKTMTKKINSDIKIEEKEALMNDIYSKLDKAAKVGVLHKKTASRKKSRLMALINKEKAVHTNK